MKKYLEAAKAVNTHGVRGDIKLEVWCDSPEVLTKIKTLYLRNGNEYLPVKIEKASVFKNMILAKPEDCNTIEQALQYKNRVFFARREDIPIEKGSFFIADLEGLPVIDEDSKTVYGTLKTVIRGGAGDIYEIERPDGKMAYMPAVKEFVIRTDLENGIFVRPIEGMFE